MAKKKWHPPEMWLSNKQASELLHIVREMDEYRKKQYEDDKILLPNHWKSKADSKKKEFENKIHELAPYLMEQRYRDSPNKRQNFKSYQEKLDYLAQRRQERRSEVFGAINAIKNSVNDKESLTNS